MNTPEQTDAATNPNYPADFEHRENRWLNLRRAGAEARKKLVAFEGSQDANSTDKEAVKPASKARPGNIAGLALSGGGIRSATFCLGVLQSLAAKQRLKQIDYLSTVSGGGYIGSFLGGWIVRDGSSVEAVERKLPDIESAEIRFLRENGRFLAPNGAGDAWGAAVVHVRNWLSMLVVVGVAALAACLLGETAKLLLDEVRAGWGTGMEGVTLLPGWAVQWSPFWKIAKWIVLLGALPLAIAYWLVFPVNGRPGWAFYVPHGSIIYLFVALVARRGLPDFIVQQPWPWFAGLMLILEWCVWADFRQRLRSSPQKHSLAGQFTLWLTIAVVAFVVAGWTFKSALLAPFIRDMPWYWFVVLAGSAAIHGTILFAHRTATRSAASPGWYRLRFVAPVVGAFGATMGRLHNIAHRIAEQDEADFTAARSGLTARLTTVLGLALAIATYSLIDSAGQTLAEHPTGVAKWAWSLMSPAALVAFMQSLLPKLLADDEGAGKSSSVFLTIGLWVGALVVLGVALVGLATAARMWAHDLSTGSALLPPWAGVAFAFVGLFVLSVVLGRRVEFVNLSSHHQLYSARLTRAYLGASNPARNPADAKAKNWQLTETIAGDQIEYGDYRPQAQGGPLHLINTTVNETVSGLSNVEQRDRKGFSFAIGPAGLSVRRSDHALFADANAFKEHRRAAITPLIANAMDGSKLFHVLGDRAPGNPQTVEMPPVGAWVGMSGAAFTTGLGARTSLATSLLLGLFNVRLGFWWDSRVPPHRREGAARRSRMQQLKGLLATMFPAQVAFSDELLARFHGVGRKHWYLSDGGHFENTACYELIRRRVPFIICCDCGCDPDYTLEDVANLVRKARLDFGAEIRFLDAAALSALSVGARSAIGPLSALRPRPNDTEGQKLGTTHAALAGIYYHGSGPPGWLLLIKPTLTARLSRDVLHYAVENPPFPQQTTMDQFFDEAQWESYRQLGWQLGEELFAIDELNAPSDVGWKPDFSKVKDLNL